MIKELAKLDGLLRLKRPEYYSILQDGVSADKLVAVEKKIGLSLPSDFRELYKWKNGQDPMKFDAMDGNREFMSLETLVETKCMLDSMIGYDFEDPKYWRTGWVPFLHNGGGSYLCLDLKAEDGGKVSQLIVFWKADQDRPVEYSSIRGWLTRLISSLEKDECQE